MAFEHPPTNSQLFLGSVSSYAFEHQYRQRNHPDFRKEQLFRYALDGDAPKTEEVRGPQTERSRLADPTPVVPDFFRPEAVPDPRESIRRRVIDRTVQRESILRAAHEKEKEILRFRVYREESVPFSRLESRRTRIYQLWWYVGDDTARLIEDPEDNSGLWQGVAIRRGALEDGDGRRLRLSDVCRSGSVIRLYGREYVVADADEFTRKWLQEGRNIDFGPARTVPSTWHHPGTTKKHDSHRPTKVAWDAGYEANGALGFYSRAPDRRARFEAAYGKELRFEVEVDETTRSGVLGDRIVGVLSYFLEDETLEIALSLSANAGRVGSRKLLSRQRVPRSGFVAVAGFGDKEQEEEEGSRGRVGFLTADELAARARKEAESRRMSARYRYSQGTWSGTYVSPITGEPLVQEQGGGGGGGRDDSASPSITTTTTKKSYLLSPDGVPIAPVDHVTPDLLQCGTTVLILGRRVRICRADATTSQWYATELGVDQAAHAHAADSLQMAAAAEKKRAAAEWDAAGIPPHEGIVAVGDEEETRRNANKLVPTYRRTADFERLYRQGGKVLRFRARLDGPRTGPTDLDRRFVVNYYLEDDTLMVFEEPSKDGGRISGKFLERGHYRNARGGQDEEFLSGGAVTSTSTSTSTTEKLKSSQSVSFDARGAALAAARGLGGSGEVYGYGHGFGQGFCGGPYGKEDRVGAAGTGVAPTRGVGLERGSAKKGYVAPPPFVRADDLEQGGCLELAHAPGQWLVLLEADSFTSEWLAARASGLSGPSLPSDTHRDDGMAATTARLSASVASSPEERIAMALSGCVASVRAFVRRADADGAGKAPLDIVAGALRRWGAVEPHAAETDAIDLCNSYSIPSNPSMVDYVALFGALERRQNLFPRMQARRETMADKAVRQLRSAILSSRDHLRRVFRELGRDIEGVITPKEFAGMLRRHHLDVGLDDGDILAIMSAFPPPVRKDPATYPAGSIDWKGFLSHIAGQEIDERDHGDLLRIIGGMEDRLLDGAGVAPETFAHVPKPIRWRQARGQAVEPTTTTTTTFTDFSTTSTPTKDHPTGMLPASDTRRPAASPIVSTLTRTAEENKEDDRMSEHKSPERPDTGVRAAMRDFFATRGQKLRDVFALFDPERKGLLARTSVIAAIEAAGFSMTLDEAADFLRASPMHVETGPAQTDLWIDYRPFLLEIGVHP